jgi:hypothetical protein
MGLIAEIFSHRMFKECSNGGISSRVEAVCVINADGPFEPKADRPAVMLCKHAGHVVARPVDPETGKVIEGVMFGGAFISTSDSRFRQAVESLLGRPFYGAIPLHDRVEL